MIETLPRPTHEPESYAATPGAGDTCFNHGRRHRLEVSHERLSVEQTPLVGVGGDPRTKKTMDAKLIFFLGLLLAASGLVSPPVALVGGIAYGFTVEHPLRREASSLAKLLLQLSVILLGFGMNLNQVIRVGKSGFLYTAISITSAVAIGLLLGKLLKIRGKASYLITMGTAICGGSAIAALAPITEANEEEISISMGTVFLLNSVALLVFPAVGWWLHLSQNQFGLWAALAIHDTSSVVGAAAKYGNQALAIGTTVKLARALWIVPISLLTASMMSRVAGAAGKAHKAKVKIPWFIFSVHPGFGGEHLSRSLCALLRKHEPPRQARPDRDIVPDWHQASRRRTLKQVGFRPLLQGIVLWILVGCASLAAIYYHVISI